MAAAVELPRRLAALQGALAGVYPFKVLELARALAEPALLGQKLKAWDPGHDALVAARLLDGPHTLRLAPDLPRPPVAAALARTLSSLRRAGVAPEALDALAHRSGHAAEDAARLAALASLYRRFHEVLEEFADPARLLRTATAALADVRWLDGADALVAGEPELDPLEREFLAALARRMPVRFAALEAPAGLAASGFASWAAAAGLRHAPLAESPLAPLAVAQRPPALERLGAALFEPPAGDPVRDDSVELITAPGETAEVAAVVRRLLREAEAGVPFEEMGIALARPDTYAALFTDTLERLGIPHRLHPSLPLRFGRTARSLLLLLRCRGLERPDVMEFLTFARIPFGELLGAEVTPRPAHWDAISRDARIVSGLDRWIVGLRSHAEQEREAADREADAERRARRLRRAADAEALLRLVELLSGTLDGLAGEASWPEWSERLQQVVDQWIGADRDREAVAGVVADLAGLGSVAGRAAWSQVESVLEARFEWERMPLPPVIGGAIHVGALDAIAGVPFRVLAIPGLVEGGFPGVLRPDPFLLDGEREALGAAGTASTERAPDKGQLSLFDPAAETRAGGDASARVPTTHDRLLEARRAFHRAIGQAGERLILSYPRADPRSGRERLPSLFFAAAAVALEGRPLSGEELERAVGEDDLDTLPLERALDAGERDRLRVRRGGEEAERAIAGGSSFFQQSRLAAEARWSRRLTAYEGLVLPLPAELARRLDPVTAGAPLSASRLATFTTCGFQYLLKHVLRLEPAEEPEERKKLEPLERGDLFHRTAERFLRERRDRGELPLHDAPETRESLLRVADEMLDALVAGSPPRFTVLWRRERDRFRDTLLEWLDRELRNAGRATPAYFEVGFGLPAPPAAGEPDSPEPLVIELEDGRSLRLSGKIDRIDRLAEGGLVLRDYKTGRAPRDDGGVFRGGRQLQIPFYVLAAEALFPGERVVEAFLDYVDGGRRVTFDLAAARGDAFRSRMRDLVDALGRGVFVQEPAACQWCDYTAVCGPKGLLELRRGYKMGDARLQAALKLREL
jgi:RecB family exonuclease